ncbi:hypothetical protein GF359_07955 [candidate division WOR-3 bacterium]|uniref:4-vinyl reductase 4VR domain-containing protein n=1 Tax=candidate division WOR-3 bacterium TaxID=2052148 RepID=A0A9D5KBJ3_UNCW3|nr:hypothetical protein [candidate division WOR-3 bacterium]MBD3365134.1 hypothetical protein [candidate division WOR-3 bacterium]
MTETLERGVTPVLVKLWVKDRFGQEGVEKVTARLEGDALDMFENPVSNNWYPVTYLKQIYSAISDEFGKDKPSLFTDYGRFDAENSTKGALRFLMRLVSGKNLIKRVRTFWKHYVKGASLDITDIKKKDGHTEITLVMEGYDAGPPGCRAIEGYIQTLLPKAGVHDVKITEKTCIHKGDDICSWLVSWDEK